MDINRLLHLDEVGNFLDKNDLFFLKFLLVEKAGLNARNEIAHGFYDFEEYSVDHFQLLLLALLRLAKYELKSTDTDDARAD